jgi:hypothetical protein
MLLAGETQEKKPRTLPWWGVACVIIGAVPILFLFDRLGRFDLARPTLYSAGMLGAAVAMKWKLRRHVWFWIAVILIAALHVPLILFVPWTTKWVPAIVIVPIAVADLYATLGILSIVEKLLERLTASQL